MSHEMWAGAGVFVVAGGVWAVWHLLFGGEIVMWDYRLTAPEDAPEEWFEEPEEHLTEEAYIAEHSLPWWVELILQGEEERAGWEDWRDDPPSDEGLEDIRAFRVPRAARRSA